MTDPYPPWARWIAQDEDGTICVFSEPPHPDIDTVDGEGYWGIYAGNNVIRVERGTPNPHWRHSLDWLGEDDE